MKLLRSSLIAFAAILFSIFGVLAQTEKAVTKGILSLADASSDLQVTISKINATNFLSTGTEIAGGLGNITTAIQKFTVQITVPNPVAFSDDEAKDVIKAVTEFVKVHELLLNTIIGKHSLAEKHQLIAPIANGLSSNENAADNCAIVLIGLIPTQQSAAESQFDSLSATFSTAISTYKSN